MSSMRLAVERQNLQNKEERKEKTTHTDTQQHVFESSINVYSIRFIQ